MEKPGNTYFTDQQFDRALDQALLDNEVMSHPQLLETMAQHVFAASPAASLLPAREQELLRRLAGKNKSSRFYLNLLLVIVLAGCTAGGIFLLWGIKTPQPAAAATHTTHSASPSTAQTGYEAVADWPAAHKSPPAPQLIPFIFDDSINAVSAPENFTPPPSTYTRMYIPENVTPAYEEIPTLTEAETKQTAKDKSKMLREIAGRKKSYCKAPAGATNVNGTLTQVGSFYMKTTEVTNGEYRTFLNDLLVQGKHEEYLLAKPVSGNWKALGLPDHEDRYFQSSKYNEFPAVNMTRKGAELFCSWLTESMKTAIDKKEVKWSGSKPAFRLPTSAEWIYVARGGDTTMLYPWGKVVPNSTQNLHGCFLCNFNYSISGDVLNGVKVCPGYEKLKQRGYHQPIMTTAGLAIDSLLTAPVYSYNPGPFGPYCMMGNVSEMVWAPAADATLPPEARSLGGSWYSHVNNVQIEAPEQYVGVVDARAYIGFRTVMTF